MDHRLNDNGLRIGNDIASDAKQPRIKRVQQYVSGWFVPSPTSPLNACNRVSEWFASQLDAGFQRAFRNRNGRLRDRESILPLEKLEPRQMLSVAGYDLNLIVNGDFESSFTAGIQQDEDVAGWHAFADAQQNRTLDVVDTGTNRGNMLKLDSAAGKHDRIFQDVYTLAGQTYLLNFDLLGGGGTTLRADEIRVYWDGSAADNLVGEFRGLDKTNRVSLELTGPRNGLVRIELRESNEQGLGGDGLGPLIDNVELVPVNHLSIQNPSFELGSVNSTQFVYGVDQIPGWQTAGETNGSSTVIRPHGELQPERGEYYWLLDSFSNQYDGLYQDIHTSVSKSYFLTFDMASQLDSVDESNQVRVRWNNQHASTQRAADIWQTHVVSLDGTTGGLTRLEFREALPPGTLGDGDGPWIDNIHWYELDTSAVDAAVTEVKETGDLVDEQRVNVQLFEGPDRATAFSFDVLPRFDLSDEASATEDQLNVYIVSSPFPDRVLLDNGTSDGALFSFGENTVAYPPGRVRFDGRTVTIDVTEVPEHATHVDLLFQLIDTDGDDQTQFLIGEVHREFAGSTSPAILRDIVPIDPGGNIDLGGLTQTNDLRVVVENVRSEFDSGVYLADLAVQGLAGNSGRDVVIIFDELPSGVNVVNASGFTGSGSPYVNMRPAIIGAGLNKGETSQYVSLKIESPSLEKFRFAPTILSGLPNQAPLFPPVAEIRVMPGDVMRVELQATDPDGDELTWSLIPADEMPTTMFTADGVLEIKPRPEELGSYSFFVEVSDGSAVVRREISVGVEADAITTTRISGQVLDTDEMPLVGVPIELGNVSAITDSQGNFQIEFTGNEPSDTLFIRGRALGDEYPFIAEKTTLLLGHELYPSVNNVIGRPIYLPVLDLAQADPINPNADSMVIANLLPGEAASEVFVEAGTLMEGNILFNGDLSITEVPRELTPAALPAYLLPDVVVTIQPGELVFTQPAPLTLPNRAGYAPGTILDLYSINPVTGDFEIVGEMRVSNDGSVYETISGGINNSSWHFPAPPPPTPRPIDTDGNPGNSGPGSKNGGAPCTSCKATTGGNSEIELFTGALNETHNLVTYTSQGQQRGVQLYYSSLHADPRPILHLGFDDIPANDNRLLTARVEFNNGSNLTFGAGSLAPLPGLRGDENFWSLPAGGGDVEAALQFDFSMLPTGVYEFELGLALLQPNSLAGTFDESTGQLIIANEINSAMGAGWTVAGHQKIVETENGSVILMDGNGTRWYFAFDNGQYVNSSGDFSTLEKLPNGTFRRTTNDQTIFQFNASNQIASVTDRNGNLTVWSYDANDRLIGITDPVQKQTTFEYTNARVSSIIDPLGRTTTLEYDGAGNLMRISDPDASVRSFSYDDQHLMTSEINERSFYEETTYDEFGRVKKSTFRDGTVKQVQPVQTIGLLSADATIDPQNAPVVSLLQPNIATVGDNNGNTTIYELDVFGQSVSVNDAIGDGQGTLRNTDNRVAISTNANGDITNYFYDDLGNVIRIFDTLDQTDRTGLLDSYGTDFWLLFQRNLHDSLPVTPEIMISSQIATSGMIAIPGLAFQLPFAVDAGETISVELPQEAIILSSDQVESLGIHVTANDEISVKGFNAYNLTGRSADGFLALPTEILGTDYYIVSYENQLEAAGSQFAVVATEDNTTLMITLTADTGSRLANQPYAIVLDKGETYQLSNATIGSDLSGSKVVADKPVAVTSGHTCANVEPGENYCDHLVEQLMPVDYWGTSFVTNVFGGRNGTDVIYRFFAALDNTEIVLDNQLVATLDAGEFHEELLDSPVVVSSSNPIQVAQYEFASSHFGANIGDPSLILITPNDNFTTSYQIGLPDSSFGGSYFDNFVNIIIPTDAIATLQIDGQPVGSDPFQLVGNSRFSMGQVPVSSEFATITSDAPMGVYMYGFIIFESYGLPAGFSLQEPGQSFTYESGFNQLTSYTDSLGHTIVYGIDPNNGNRVSETRVIGELDSPQNGETDDLVIRYEYTPEGLIDKIENERGIITDYDYNSQGLVERITFALGTVDEAFQTFEYDDVGNPRFVMDAEGNVTEYRYDSLNNLLKTIVETDPDGAGPLTSPITRFTYDARGNLLTIRDARGNTTTNQYDEMDRVIASIDELGTETSFAYDGNGNLTVVVDPLGNETTNNYDVRDRLIETIDAEGGHTYFEYDLNDNLVSLIDPVDNQTQFEYDARDRLVKEIDPLTKETVYDYDLANNLIRKTDRNLRVTEFVYDDVNRLTDEIWINTDASTANEIAYTYSPTGFLKSAIDDNTGVIYEYDFRDRVESVESFGSGGIPTSVLTYDYDNAGNVRFVNDTVNGVAGATTEYLYDNLNRLETIIQSGNNVADKSVDFGYNSLGQFESISRFSDLTGTNLVATTTYSYDDLNRIQTIVHRNSNELLSFFDYEYDDSSRIVEIENIDGIVTYGYDRTSQLTSADYDKSAFADEFYVYDANGNREASHLHGNDYETDAGNLLVFDGTYRYQYDDEGNMIRRTIEVENGESGPAGSYRVFEWDHRNRLVAVNDYSPGNVSTQEVRFEYDSIERRIARVINGKSTFFVHDRDRVLLDIEPNVNPANSIVRYLRGPSVDQLLSQDSNPEQTTWTLTDHLGSVVGTVDQDGNLESRLVYDVFGNTSSTEIAESIYQFTGRESETEVSLQYNRARFYDSRIGRFVSQDPIGFAGLDSNPFRYALNSPVGFTDPTGTVIWPIVVPALTIAAEAAISGVISAFAAQVALKGAQDLPPKYDVATSFIIESVTATQLAFSPFAASIGLATGHFFTSRYPLEVDRFQAAAASNPSCDLNEIKSLINQLDGRRPFSPTFASFGNSPLASVLAKLDQTGFDPPTPTAFSPGVFDTGDQQVFVDPR